MSLLTGESPSKIESSWSEEDINWVLMVNRAQQEARIAIAVMNKVHVADIPTPTSLVLRVESEE